MAYRSIGPDAERLTLGTTQRASKKKRKANYEAIPFMKHSYRTQSITSTADRMQARRRRRNK